MGRVNHGMTYDINTADIIKETPMNPLTALPPKVRAAVYVGYAFVGIVVGAVQVGYLSAGYGQPVWLTVALAVVPFLGAGLGLTAASNTQTGTPIEAEVVNAPVNVVDLNNDGHDDETGQFVPSGKINHG